MSFPLFKPPGLQGKHKILHMSWMAFFISFVVWFNHAPLMMLIQQTLRLSNHEVETLLLLNVALTIPARVIIGLLVDRFGARISYSLLLAFSSIPCWMFAFADDFVELAWSRFLLGFIGAGFVVGVRIIGDWFPSRQIGTAEGIYAGLGNFGAAVAALCLPGLAGYLGWRQAVAVTGLMALAYSVVYYRHVEDFPPERAGLQGKRTASLEVSSIQDLFLYLISLLPLYGALSLLIRQLVSGEQALMAPLWAWGLHGVIWAVFMLHAQQLIAVNTQRLSRPIACIHHYRYRQVFLLAVAYLITFGSKLAVLSMLPKFFFDTFAESQGLSLMNAGLLASSFVITNVIARPAGGWLSDRIGRKLSLGVFGAGLAVGYGAMAMITPEWTLTASVIVTLLCSLFMQAAEGAIFAFVPLVKKSITGEVAGIVGAYGNAGAIVFLIVFSHLDAGDFFLLLSACCMSLLVLVHHLDEPQHCITEILPDGTLHKIELK